MTDRVATYSCGQYRVSCIGEHVGISNFHCLECRKRIGIVHAVQARFPRAHVTIAGANHLSRRGDSGGSTTFSFCPTCGATVFWEPAAFPDFIMVAVGALADPGFPLALASVCDDRQHPWTLALGEHELEDISWRPALPGLRWLAVARS